MQRNETKDSLSTSPRRWGGIFQLFYPPPRGSDHDTPPQQEQRQNRFMDDNTGSGPGEGQGELVIVVTDAGAGHSTSHHYPP